jgi:hypothetical protein
MVAWDGIEPSTRGFSTHLSKLQTVFSQAFAASQKWGVRVFAAFRKTLFCNN